MSFAIGENVGPYRILEKLGQGGMATVFKAYHAALDRYVAMKVLHPAFMQDPNFIARFEREAKVVARLEHPHIVPIYDYAEHNGQPYLVMKYIEGQTLKARLNQRPLSKQEAVEVAEAVGGALGYAHQQGVLHRDIKPSNVLLGKDGSIYLADFGLARIAQAGESTLSKDVMLGTPQYISPEQAQGLKELDEGTDIYSMGVVLYELVVGRVPFNADTPFSIIHDHIYADLPVPSVVNPSVPKNVERLLLKALSKERRDRFESVEQLIRAFHVAVYEGEAAEIPGMDAAETRAATPEVIHQDLQPESVRISAGVGPGAQPKPRRRWPWVLGGIGLTCLCLVGFIIVAGNRNGEAMRTPQDQAPIAEALKKPPVGEAVEDLPSLDNVKDPQAHFERAKRLEGSDRPILAAQAYFKAGELFLNDKRYAEAVESYIRSMELGGLDIERPERAGEDFTEALYFAAAEIPIYAQLERLEKLSPDGFDRSIFLARTELFHGELETARRIITQFVEANPNHPLAMSVLAEVYLRAGEDEKAQSMISMGLENRRALSPWLSEHLNALQLQVNL
ncbi:MAG: serine/threonine protein kinase [Anaerolineales bacterium]|nr:MAG: serine/threonine protein kinase [Anaerolineales bacterium]